jgi:hypothetical protein
LRCRFDVPLDYPAVTVAPRFRREMALAVGEAVNNVIRHAQARKLQVQIELADQTLSFVSFVPACGTSQASQSSEHVTTNNVVCLIVRLQAVSNAGFIRERNRLASAGSERTVKVWDARPLSQASNREAKTQ